MADDHLGPPFTSLNSSLQSFFRQGSNVEINGSHFNDANNVTYNYPSNQPLDILHRHIARGALLDSNERFNPPRCDLGTRLVIINRIMDWITDPNSRSSILWLHGPAGAGKSALAQSIAEKCKAGGILAAVFFFSRNAVSSERSDGNRLIATLVYQLIEKFPKMQSSIEKCIRRNISIFARGMQTQSKNLLVSPLNKLKKSLRFRLSQLSIFQVTYARFFVIDGLDECSDAQIQREILEVLAKAAQDLKFPFRILICSRPESHIRNFFDHSPILGKTDIHQIDLALDNKESADNDIRMYLSRRFTEIIDTHPLREYIPPLWPSKDAIEKIASHSSGQFIYAVTVTKYIQSPKNQPTDRLECILGIMPVPVNDKPYAALDTLYTHIFLSADDLARAKQIFSLLAISRTPNDGLGTFNTPEMIDKLLFFRPGDTLLILTDFSSIVSFDKKTSPISHYHASLNDFLRDPTRSGVLHVGLTETHAQLARGYLKLIQSRVQYGPGRDQAEAIDFESVFMAFISNYGRLTSNIPNELVIDLENMDLWNVFGKLSFTSRSSEVESRNILDSISSLSKLWESGIMERLFRLLTQSDNFTNGHLLQAQMRTFLQMTPRIVQIQLGDSLFALLAQPQFKQSMFCGDSVCSREKSRSCQSCRSISPIATELSYHVLYAQIFHWGAYEGCHTTPHGMLRVNAYLKYAHAFAEDIMHVDSKNRTKEIAHQRTVTLRSNPYAKYFFEAILNYAILTLPYSTFSISMWVIMEQIEPIIDSWGQNDSALRHLSPRFQELRVQINACKTRMRPSWEKYKKDEGIESKFRSQ